MAFAADVLVFVAVEVLVFDAVDVFVADFVDVLFFEAVALDVDVFLELAVDDGDGDFVDFFVELAEAESEDVEVSVADGVFVFFGVNNVVPGSGSRLGGAESPVPSTTMYGISPGSTNISRSRAC